MITATYKIPNISCHHCIHTIVSELSELPGVQLVEGDVQSKQIKVNYDEPATPEKIEGLLAEINYPAEK